MERFLGRFAPQIYALLRIVSGLLFACHGAQKLFGVLGGHQASLMSQFGLAGVIEFVGGLMIAAGIFTGFAAFIASGEMAVVYFQAHAPRGTLPIQTVGKWWCSIASCFCTSPGAAVASGASVGRPVGRWPEGRKVGRSEGRKAGRSEGRRPSPINRTTGLPGPPAFRY